MRIVRGREAVLRLRVDDEGGTLVAADATPSVAVTDGDGNAISGLGTPAVESTGVYTVTLPPRSDLDVLTVTWTATVGAHVRTVTDTVEVVADRLVPLWRLREDSELAAVSTAAILRLADTVESWFESALRFPAVESPLRASFDHPGGRRLRVPGAPAPKSVIAITDNDTVLSASQLSDVNIVEGALEYARGSNGFLSGAAGREWSCGLKTVWITHGSPWWSSPPEDVVKAAATLARYVSRGSNYPERARVVQIEAAIINLATPDPDHPTGLPDVDAVINRYRLDYAV